MELIAYLVFLYFIGKLAKNCQPTSNSSAPAAVPESKSKSKPKTAKQPKTVKVKPKSVKYDPSKHDPSMSPHRIHLEKQGYSFVDWLTE